MLFCPFFRGQIVYLGVKAAIHKDHWQMAGRGGILWVSLLLSFFYAFPCTAFAQSSPPWMYAGVRDMVYAEGAGFGEASWMAVGDPLAGRGVSGFQGSFSMLMPFGIGQMASPAFGFSQGSESARIGMAILRSGGLKRSYQRYSLASSLRLNENIRAGIGLGLLEVRYDAGQSPLPVLLSQLAFQIDLSREATLHLGFREPYEFILREAEAYRVIPALSTALQWRAAEGLTALFEIRRNTTGPVSMLGGLELEVNPQTKMHFSYHSLTRRSGLGIQYLVGRFSAGFAATYHPVLGISPGFELGYRKKGK